MKTVGWREVIEMYNSKDLNKKLLIYRNAEFNISSATDHYIILTMYIPTNFLLQIGLGFIFYYIIFFEAGQKYICEIEVKSDGTFIEKGYTLLNHLNYRKKFFIVTLSYSIFLFLLFCSIIIYSLLKNKEMLPLY